LANRTGRCRRTGWTPCAAHHAGGPAAGAAGRPAGRERQAARQASVIGHVFWDDALQALDAQAPQALPALQRAAFVKAHDSSDFEGTPERQFDHHLLHQVTYDTLLKAERKLGHGAAARWLAERTQGRGAEFLAMTGEHAERAGETALAIDCFEQAGLRGAEALCQHAAMSWLRRALALLGWVSRASRAGWTPSRHAATRALGRPAAALAQVEATLDRLPRELADCPTHETIELRWRCQQVLHALRDARAAALLQQLHADVQATATQRTEAADRDRLIQSIPTYPRHRGGVRGARRAGQRPLNRCIAAPRWPTP
jgi:predicted ATPase